MRTKFVTLATLALSCVALTPQANADAPKTNVVLILIDDLGWKETAGVEARKSHSGHFHQRQWGLCQSD